jgi:hypothetical protein
MSSLPKEQICYHDERSIRNQNNKNNFFLINTYVKKDATHLIISISRVEDKAFLNIFGNSWGDIP